MPFAAPWMDLEIITLRKLSQTKTNTIRYHLYMKSKHDANGHIYNNRNKLIDTENRLVVAREWGWCRREGLGV